MAIWPFVAVHSQLGQHTFCYPQSSSVTQKDPGMVLTPKQSLFPSPHISPSPNKGQKVYNMLATRRIGVNGRSNMTCKQTGLNAQLMTMMIAVPQ